jgi:hypothetical protein
MIVTFACPPPSHITCSPYRPPVRSRLCSSVVISRAPVAPIGWPSAIAPPLALTRSLSAPVSASHASTTDANASLTSNKSMSETARPARARACLVAGIGAVSIQTGSAPRAEIWCTRALGLTP